MAATEFGTWLKRAREARSLAVKDAASMAGLQPSRWSQWEGGHRAAPKSEDLIAAIAVALNVPEQEARWAAGLTVPTVIPHEVSDYESREREDPDGKLAVALVAARIVTNEPKFLGNQDSGDCNQASADDSTGHASDTPTGTVRPNTQAATVAGNPDLGWVDELLIADGTTTTAFADTFLPIWLRTRSAPLTIHTNNLRVVKVLESEWRSNKFSNIDVNLGLAPGRIRFGQMATLGELTSLWAGERSRHSLCVLTATSLDVEHLGLCAKNQQATWLKCEILEHAPQCIILLTQSKVSQSPANVRATMNDHNSALRQRMQTAWAGIQRPERLGGVWVIAEFSEEAIGHLVKPQEQEPGALARQQVENGKKLHSLFGSHFIPVVVRPSVITGRMGEDCKEVVCYIAREQPASGAQTRTRSCFEPNQFLLEHQTNAHSVEEWIPVVAGTITASPNRRQES